PVIWPRILRSSRSGTHCWGVFGKVMAFRKDAGCHPVRWAPGKQRGSASRPPIARALPCKRGSPMAVTSKLPGRRNKKHPKSVVKRTTSRLSLKRGYLFSECTIITTPLFLLNTSISTINTVLFLYSHIFLYYRDRK